MWQSCHYQKEMATMPRKFPPTMAAKVPGRSSKLGQKFYSDLSREIKWPIEGGYKRIIPVDDYDADYEPRTLTSYHAR